MLISFSGIWCLCIVWFAQKWPSSARSMAVANKSEEKEKRAI